MSKMYFSKYISEETNKVHICVFMYIIHTYKQNGGCVKQTDIILKPRESN